MKLLITGGSGFIGTNLVQACIDSGVDFINVDYKRPLNSAHELYWKDCNIMDLPRLSGIFETFQPTAVVHLAARTDTDIYDLNADMNQYIQNTEGTKNVLHCIKTTDVKRAIITSSMFVCKPGYMPGHDEDFNPYTLYGLSKVLTEKYTRSANLSCTWTIIRPQTIWGPWCVRYTNNMFRIMKKGLYFHPNKANVYRAYGYIGNVIWQISKILTASHEAVHQQALYVGDRPINLLQWVNCVSNTLVGKDAQVIPTPLVQGIALSGDVLKLFGIKFPITMSRFRSMVQDYLTPIEKTFDILGTPPYSMENGVREFIEWNEAFADTGKSVPMVPADVN